MSTIKELVTGKLSTAVKTDLVSAINEASNAASAHKDEHMPHDSELSQYSTGADVNGIYATVTYKRPDNTIYMTSNVSNPDSNGNYQTIKWQFYNKQGTAVLSTKTWTISYDENGTPNKKELS